MGNAIQNWEQMTYPFHQIKLNYSLDAFEPHISIKTMRAHYNLISDSYIKNLNQTLMNRLDLQNMTLNELFTYAEINKDLNLRHLVGGIYQHFFFFSELRPATGQIIIGITPKATQKITNTFGSWKTFKEEFTKAALNVWGAGYVWLIKDNQSKLAIITMVNHNVPQNCTPILCLDIWEHAYYLQHLNNRQAYVDAFWNVIDWVKFSERIA